MLSENQLVKARKAIEKMYDGTCAVVVHEEYEKPNGSAGFRDVITVESEPCHLSFNSAPAANNGDAAASVSQVVELFISPDVQIAAGSKIIVTQNGTTTDYSNSGMSAKYATHQQIILKLWEGWS